MNENILIKFKFNQLFVKSLFFSSSTVDQDLFIFFI